MIQTKKNIFIEDKIMEKIINFMKTFSKTFRNQLENLRSSKASVKLTGEKIDKILEKKIDLDEINLEFIELILNTLEYF